MRISEGKGPGAALRNPFRVWPREDGGLSDGPQSAGAPCNPAGVRRAARALKSALLRLRTDGKQAFRSLARCFFPFQGGADEALMFAPSFIALRPGEMGAIAISGGLNLLLF